MLPSTTVRAALLALEQRDLTLRAELAADGVLFEGYHPRMEALHRENARQLREWIARVGWPGETVAGEDGAAAAWLIAQHAIAEPDFMRHCRQLLEVSVASGETPMWQYAYLDDRIRVFESKAQRFGTQISLTPAGPVVCDVEDAPTLNRRRREAGLEPLAKRIKAMKQVPRPTLAEFAARQAAELAWRRKVGWLLNTDTVDQ